MSEQPYTPDEFNVRMAWVTTGIGPEDNLNAEFDRFVAKVKADAWDEGYRAGSQDMSDLRAGRLTFQTITSNPYWQEATR